MNRPRRLLFCLLLATVCMMTASAGDELVFHGASICYLAQTIAVESRKTNQLPTSFRLPTKDGTELTITAINAFELLVRATADWSSEGRFPDEVSLQLRDLSAPSFNLKYEPAKEMQWQNKAVLSKDLGKYAECLIKYIELPGHRIPIYFKFGETDTNAYALTAAQALVAFAVLIDTAIRRHEFPEAIAVPMIFSPFQWDDHRNTLPVAAPSADDTMTLSRTQPRTVIQTPGQTQPATTQITTTVTTNPTTTPATTATPTPTIINTAPEEMPKDHLVTLRMMTPEQAIAALQRSVKGITAKAVGTSQLLLSGDPTAIVEAKGYLRDYDKGKEFKLFYADPDETLKRMRLRYKESEVRTVKTANGNLWLTGDPDKMKDAIEVLKDLDAPPPPPVVVAPPPPTNALVQLKWIDAKVTMPKLKARFPNASFTPGPSNSITVLAEQSQINAIRIAIADMDIEPPPLPPPAELRVTLNGTDINAGDSAPPGRLPSTLYCGIVHADLIGAGPVKSITVQLDLVEITTCQGPGTHPYDINTTQYSDSTHTLTVSLLDTSGRSSVFIYHLTFMNGRQSNINPIQGDSGENEGQ